MVSLGVGGLDGVLLGLSLTHKTCEYPNRITQKQLLDWLIR